MITSVSPHQLCITYGKSCNRSPIHCTSRDRSWTHLHGAIIEALYSPLYIATLTTIKALTREKSVWAGRLPSCTSMTEMCSLTSL